MPGVQISILAANVSSLLGMGYSRIELWWSIDQGNSYAEITSSTAQPAKLTSLPALTTYRMGGKLLKLSVNGAAEVSIAFSSLIDYWTPTQVVNRINEVVPTLASVSGTTVVLTSTTTGRASSLKIVYNDAIDLGFEAEKVVYGTAARPTLVSDTFIYVFSDPSGSSDYRYKWRFSANGVNPISGYSKVLYGNTPALAEADVLSVCTATFIGLDGVAKAQDVIVALEQNPMEFSGYVVGDKLPKMYKADENGFIQFTLVRGARVKVALEGTTFVREFTVPSTPSFDLLEAMAAAPDAFTIQTPLPFLIRRNV